MKVTGTTTLHAPMEKVWQSFLDPDVLVRTIPGCEHLEATGENQYMATVSAGVGSIKGTYQGKVELSDLHKHESLLLHAQAAGATGTIGVDVLVTVSDLGDGTTKLDYDADAVVGGVIGGVGQRMLTSVSKRMANEFFANINKALTGQLPKSRKAPAKSPPVAPEATAAGSASKTGGAPAAAVTADATDHQDLLKGFLAGAVTALLGVLVGVIAARRR